MTRVVLQASAAASSFIEPCLEILPAVNQPPVPGGAQACSPFSGGSVLKDIELPAGTYFVLVSDGNNNETGDYTLLLQTP